MTATNQETQNLYSASIEMTQGQKAAIIVKLLLQQGADIELSKLPHHLQAELTHHMGNLGLVDRATLANVVSEFANDVDQIGLSGRNGLQGALKVLSGKIDHDTEMRLRQDAGVKLFDDPWARLKSASNDDLLELIDKEPTEVSAVLLSKLDVQKSAELLAALSGEIARKISLAILKTSSIAPQSVERIGQSLVAELDNRPQTAFVQKPASRIGAILTAANPALRDDVLEGLNQSDPEFASAVRDAIFTFDDIPKRVLPTDIAKAMRGIDNDDLARAFAYATTNGQDEVTDFILDNLSKRMAETIRDAIKEIGNISKLKGEKAISAVVGEIQNKITAGEIQFAQTDVE